MQMMGSGLFVILRPVPRQDAVVLTAVKAEPRPGAGVAAEGRPALTAAARAGVLLMRPGRKNAPRGRTKEWQARG